LADLQ
jgi:hypothetical protein